MSWKEYEDAADRGPISFGVKIILGVATLAIVAGAIVWGLNVLSQPGAVLTKTFDADNMIYNYEWFRSQYQAVLAMDVQITNAQVSFESFKKDNGPRGKMDFSTGAEYDRLNAILLGLQNQRANYVGTYNARASQANRSIFMGKELPPVLQ